MSSPQIPTPQKRSSKQYSFAWFRHGCCVPTTSVLWMMVVLFIFAVTTCVFCCLIMNFVRWIYQRRIRKKADSLRAKYRREDEQRREMDNRMKEIAMRPVHHPARFYEEPGLKGDFMRSQLRAISPLQYEYQKQNIQQAPEKPTIPTKPDVQLQASPKKIEIFTGNTPLHSSSLKLCDYNASAAGDEKTPDSYFAPPATTTDVGQSTQSMLPSTTVTATTTSQVDEIQMEPADLAKTVHTMAKEWHGHESRPPLPGIVVVPKKRLSLHAEESILSTSDGTVTQSDVSTSKHTTTKATSSTLQPTTETQEPQRSQVESSKQLPTKTDKVPPYAGPYFPYWTARRMIMTKVERNVTPSGRVFGKKVSTSEHSVWASTGTGRTVSQSTKVSEKPKEPEKPKDPKRPDETPPHDVYRLRREVQRLRANEISLGMRQVLYDSRKRNQPHGPIPSSGQRFTGVNTASHYSSELNVSKSRPHKALYVDSKDTCEVDTSSRRTSFAKLRDVCQEK